MSIAELWKVKAKDKATDKHKDKAKDDKAKKPEGYGPFRIMSFSLAAYNSDPRSYPDSGDFPEVFEGLPGRERDP